MWQFSASCTPDLTDLFFSELGSKVAKAKAICAECPVQAKCLAFALDPANEISAGTFGGTTQDERKILANV